MVRLLCLMRNDDSSVADLFEAGPGFTLPADIGDLDPTIIILDLFACNLKGLKLDIL